MSDLTLHHALQQHAQQRPDAIALEGNGIMIRYRDLPGLIADCAASVSGQRVALLMDNHPAWAILDLALLNSERLCVPLPTFFSDEQLLHAIQNAGVDTVITDRPERLRELPLIGRETLRVAQRTFHILFLAAVQISVIPSEVAKITYTSGTTASPKGVCLSGATLQAVIDSLAEASGTAASDRILALLPLSTLLENIGSVYVALQSGATAILATPDETGLHGSNQLSIPDLLTCLQRTRPTGLIVIPQLLQVLLAARQQNAVPDSLRFIAVGGAPLAWPVLQAATDLGLPVYQGYGLSEAASVVCLNTPANNRPGSVGKVLPHVELRIARDGEIILRGNLFSGYLGDAPRDANDEYHTGDLGYLDADGYLYLTGRRKNMFITSFGRNVAPEWIECELQADSLIKQAAVFGEARPYNVAVIVAPGANSEQLRASIATINQRLPDYAQVKKFLLADTPFTPDNGMLTANGRLRRAKVASHYQHSLESLYEDEVA